MVGRNYHTAYSFCFHGFGQLMVGPCGLWVNVDFGLTPARRCPVVTLALISTSNCMFFCKWRSEGIVAISLGAWTYLSNASFWLVKFHFSLFSLTGEFMVITNHRCSESLHPLLPSLFLEIILRTSIKFFSLSWQDCFGRPIAGPPDAWIDVVERYSNDNNKTLL